MTEKLRIFVSGKEGELVNERALTMNLIRFLDFTAIGSEKRPASSESMKEENTSEVNTSDIYIGIFGGIYSEATIREFRNARLQNIPTLIFEKELPDDENRDERVLRFLKEIKDPKTGLVVAPYKNVVELKRKILDALSYCLTKKFRDARRLQEKIKDEKTDQSNAILFDAVGKSANEDNLLSKMQKMPFVTRFSKQFGKAEFENFKIISVLKKDAKHIVSARIKGSTENGFLDLAIRDPDGKYHWFPDPHSYDSAKDNGLLFLQNVSWKAEWEFYLPDKSGNYLAIMGLYENEYANRETVNFELFEFTLI